MFTGTNLRGLFLGAAFIGFVAPLLVDFNKDETIEGEEDIDVEISFEN